MELAVQIAQEAVGLLGEDEEESTGCLYLLMFRFQLQLGRYEEAYTAMMATPDTSR